MKFSKKDRSRLYMLAGIFIIGMFAIQMGWLSAWGIKPFFTFQSALDEDQIDVYIKINTKVTISKAAGGSDVINMYDANGAFLDTVTCSSGVGTFPTMQPQGRHVWLQSRIAAPATADGYVTPLAEFYVPTGADAGDTVSLISVATGESTIWTRDVTSSAPTLVVRNGWNNATVSSTANQFNTTDDHFTITLTLSTSNTWYGAQDFTDMETGRVYDGGIFFMWKCTSGTQSWVDLPKYTFSDMTNIWYVWEISAAGIYYDANDLPKRIVSWTNSVTTTQGSFNDDSGITIDIYDIIDVALLGQAACFIDGGGVAVTGVSTDCS